jgi:hypothetical protein
LAVAVLFATVPVLDLLGRGLQLLVPRFVGIDQIAGVRFWIALDPIGLGLRLTDPQRGARANLVADDDVEVDVLDRRVEIADLAAWLPISMVDPGNSSTTI